MIARCLPSTMQPDRQPSDHQRAPRWPVAFKILPRWCSCRARSEQQRSGAGKACLAHDQEVSGAKPFSPERSIFSAAHRTKQGYLNTLRRKSNRVSSAILFPKARDCSEYATTAYPHLAWLHLAPLCGNICPDQASISESSGGARQREALRHRQLRAPQ